MPKLNLKVTSTLKKKGKCQFCTDFLKVKSRGPPWIPFLQSGWITDPIFKGKRQQIDLKIAFSGSTTFVLIKKSSEGGITGGYFT